MKPLLIVGAVLLGLGAVFWVALEFAGPGGARYAAMDGAAIYERLCSRCHGDDGRGRGGLGASYAGKRGFWDEASLLRYLRDPAAFQRKDARLGARYMPPVDGTMPQDARKRLVEHVFGLMEALDSADG